jgi:hypothetical protein
MRGALLVPHKDVPHSRVLGQRVVQGKYHASGVSEDRVDTFALEAFQHHLCAS